MLSSFPLQRSVLNLFALTESDPQQRITVLISFFSSTSMGFFFFPPSQRLPWLSAKSILPLVGDNEHVRRASNEHRCSWAPQLNTVTSCRHFWGEAEKRSLGLQRPIKNTYSNWPKRSTARHSFAALPRPHSFPSLSDLSRLFSTPTNKQFHRSGKKKNPSHLCRIKDDIEKVVRTHTCSFSHNKRSLWFKGHGGRIYQLCSTVCIH